MQPRTKRMCVLALLATNLLSPVWAQQSIPITGTNCVATAACIASGCIPIPTTLRAVSSAPGDWEGGGANCGIKRRFIIFVTPCGPPLAAGYCVSSDGVDP